MSKLAAYPKLSCIRKRNLIKTPPMKKLPFKISKMYEINRLLAISIMILLITSSSCNQIIPHPEIQVVSISKTYNQASNIAQKWRSDAQLYFAEFDFSVNGYPDRIMGIYQFLSLSSNKLLSLAIDKTGTPQIQMEDDWPQDSPTGVPLFIQDLHLDTQQALAIIMENGGYSFFSRNRITDDPLDMFFLRAEHLYENSNSPMIWTGGFVTSNPHAQLYISIDDASGKLLKVKAYGEQEQEYWFRDITVTKKISVGSSKRFFDYFDLRVNSVQYQNRWHSANLTIICPEFPLLSGELTYKHISQNSPFSFGDYQITLLRIDPNWVEVEVMPTIRWYEPVSASHP